MINYGYLTGEEYRAIRELLGFSQQEAADFHGMAQKLTINQWEWNKNTVSRIACDAITNLINKINDKIEEIITKWENDKQDVFLITYNDEDYQKYTFGLGRELPNSVHTMMIYRAYIELKRIGALAYIVKFNKDSYAYFMADLGKVDTAESRNEWAKWYRLNYFNVLPPEKEERRATVHTADEMYLWLTDHPNIKNFKRYMDIVKLRMDGNNLTQVAQLLGITKQRVNQLWHDLDNMVD